VGLPLVITAETTRGPAQPTASAPQPADGPRTWIGNGGCSSRGCHGAVAPEGTKGSEYNTWKVFDRHARASAVLFNDRSRTIEKNLKGLAKLEAAHAEADALCLKCHDQPVAPQNAHPILATTGVGCEACHGPASGWLAEHSRPGWKNVSRAQKQSRGMVLMDTAAALTWVCVRCHVGTADQEVNHDLIAAGHPRLNFEAAAFLDDMPKHWDEADVDRKHGPITAAENWAIGQVVTARAALDVLARRADGTDAPWPEFTEYGCFACHHDIRGGGARYWRPELGLRPGALPWGTWSFAMLDALADRPGGLTKDLHDLTHSMGLPSPDRRDVAKQASTIAASLDAWLEQMQTRRFTTRQLQEAAGAIRNNPPALAQRTAYWDAAAQLYLMLAALDLDLGPDSVRREALDALRRLLDFPTSWDGTGQDSPGRNFDPAQVREAVDKVLQTLPTP